MALKLRVSENRGIPWTQTQEYMDLCRMVSRTGDPTTYNPPHPQGYSSTDVTQFQVGLASSNINNLPDVMYQLWPNKEWWDHTKSAKPLPKKDANGDIMYERTPRAWAPRELLDFPILRNLDTISSEEEAWFLEMLLRMDGRIEWTDILMRMEYPGYTEKDEQKVRNRLQQRMARFREKSVMVSWRDTAGDNNAIRDRVLEKLTPAQLAARGGLGSTRGSTPGSRDSQGRVIPVPGRSRPKTASTGKTGTQVQQPRSQTGYTTVHGRSAYSEANARIQHGQASTKYAARRYTQQVENTLDAGFHPALQESDQLSSGGDDWGNNDFGNDEGDDGDDEQESGESSDSYDDDGSDWNEVADADMLSTEESSRMKLLTPEECCELERYLKEDRTRTQMCLDGMMSVDELMLDMQNNGDELKQSLRRTRGEISDDDEVEEILDRRAKRTRREEGTTEPSSQPLLYLQQPTSNGFHYPQPGSFGEYRCQGALGKTFSRPTTRPFGSAVQRLHNDRLRRPPMKATVAQKNIYETLHYPQPEIVMEDEWTVWHCHTDSQPLHYTTQHPGGEGGLYTDIGQQQGRLARYESRQDDTRGTRNTDTNTGERQARPSSHHQRQPDRPTDGDNSSNSGSSSDPVESTCHEDQHTAPHQAPQQPTARTIQDDPFFPDELFNGMLNGQPHNRHVGSIYTRSQQQEIDEYYYRLMTPRPKFESGTNASENMMPPPPRPRMEDPQTMFAADLLNPHSRPQAGGVGLMPQQCTPHSVPVAPAQPGDARPVAQVTAGASQPADESDAAIGATTSWNAEWSAFINHHDAEPLLRAHYPDEHPPVSPHSTPRQ